MKTNTLKRTALFWASVPIAAIAVIIASLNRPAALAIASASTAQQTNQVSPETSPKEQVPAPEPEVSTKSIRFYSVQVTGPQPLASLKSQLGEDNLDLVLRLNRLDRKHLRKGLTLSVPEGKHDLMAVSPMPRELEPARSLPKLILVSRDAQAFGAYESGKLVYWGPTSTGKKSTQTPAGLYHTNWRKKETRSTVNPDWILPWAFNLDNEQGIAFHQYDLPGYPASHGCVRLLSEDAQWIFNWADTWILSKKDGSRIAYGTPVIIFGNYSYGKVPPWALLASNPDAAAVTNQSAEQALDRYLSTIEAQVQARESLLLIAAAQ